MKRWLTFLRNHREVIAAMDFFTVPTLTFGILYCFFVISHDWRKDSPGRTHLGLAKDTPAGRPTEIRSALSAPRLAAP